MDTFAARLSDSKIIKSIPLNGSKKLDLQALVLQDFPICLKYRISLNDRWIPGDINARDYFIRKLTDFDN